jgi:hypothetical protein
MLRGHHQAGGFFKAFLTCVRDHFPFQSFDGF